MTHPDYDTMLNALIPFAQQMISKEGEFFPFGAEIRSSGEIGLNAPHPDRAESPTKELIDTLYAGLKSKADKGEIRAAAVCFDTRIQRPGQAEKTDAICVHLEHQNEKAIEVYVPYSKSLLGKVQYEKLVGSPADQQIFSPGGAA